MNAPALVPELLVADIATSIGFRRGLCGLDIEHQREDEGFAYLSRGQAHVMLDQVGLGRDGYPITFQMSLGRRWA